MEAEIRKEIREIIDALYSEMHRLGLTLAEVSEKCDISLSTLYSARMNGILKLQTLISLMRALDIDLCMVNREGNNILRGGKENE